MILPSYQPVPDTEVYSRAHHSSATWDAWLTNVAHLRLSRQWVWIDRYLSTSIVAGGEIWRGYIDATPDEVRYLVRTLWAWHNITSQMGALTWQVRSMTAAGALIVDSATSTVFPPDGPGDIAVRPVRHPTWLPLVYPRRVAAGVVAVGVAPYYQWSSIVENVPNAALPTVGRVIMVSTNWAPWGARPLTAPRLAAVEIIAVPAA